MTHFQPVGNLNRRRFLMVSGAAGALVVGAPTLAGFKRADATGDLPTWGSVGPYVRITPANEITIGCPNSEMGQGTTTSIPMLIAEDLDVDFDAISVAIMPLALTRDEEGRVRYAGMPQGAGGSTSVWDGYDPARQAGAVARHLLLSAAAERWGVPMGSLRTDRGTILHPASGRTALYGDFAADAAGQKLPDAPLPLKPRTEHKIIGTPRRNKQAHAIVTGAPLFGIDQEMPGMLHAVVARSPWIDGTVKAMDDSAARAIPGVRHVVKIDRTPLDQRWQTLGEGVAVVADDLWTAMKARDALDITWSPGPMRENTDASYAEARRLLAAGQGERIRQDGDWQAALDRAARVVEATYEVPMVAHAPLEPQNAIAWVQPDRVDMIAPTQSPGGIWRAVRDITGIEPENISLQVTRCGGGFGRRLYTDQMTEAVIISKAVSRPVKLQWTREDDMRHDFYRPGGVHHMQAALDGDGNVIGWSHRIASQSRRYRFTGQDQYAKSEVFPDDFPAGLVDTLNLEYIYMPSAAPRGAWRAPASVANAFAVQCFVDEVAEATGRDGLAMRQALLRQTADLPYDNHGGPRWSPARLQACLESVADRAGWTGTSAVGKGRGIAGHFTFGSYCAYVVDVSAKPDGGVAIDRVTAAVDCGIAVNPAGIRAQVEGGIHDALSTALAQEITIKDGQVQQANFDSYPMARMNQSVRDIDVAIIEGDGPVRGMGEPPVPPFAPAFVGALHDLTGVRVRRLPIGDQIRI